MKPNLPIQAYPSKLFSWNKNHGSTFATDLAGIHGLPDALIYDDALDRGFHIIGKASTELFIFSGKIYDREGDVSGWNYESVTGEFKITVFND